MHHPPPPDDYVVVHCRGRCSKYKIITFPDLVATLKLYQISLLDFRNSYICLECESRFVVMIEDISCPNPAR
jgi:hypothetical protein